MKLAKILTAIERTRFDACNKQIRDGLQSCFDTGAALAEVRDHKLYREDYKNFEAYCRETFDVSRSHAYRLISAADIKENSPAGDQIENEGQARAIARVPKKKRKKVVESVCGEGAITARAITEKANESAKPDPDLSPTGDNVPVLSIPAVPAQVLDEIGTPIPEDLHELWARRNEVESLSREVAAMETKFIALQENRDPLWQGLNVQQAIGHCQQLHQNLSGCRLYAVCITCGGRNRAKCAHCKGKGIISKFSWESHASIEAKEIRKRANAKRMGK